MSIQRTSAGLATAMFEELDSLTEGTSTPQQARAKAAIVNTIISTTRLEMDYARFVADQRGEEGALKPLSLGIKPAALAAGG
jgi:hypothetical protein